MHAVLDPHFDIQKYSSSSGEFSLVLPMFSAIRRFLVSYACTLLSFFSRDSDSLLASVSNEFCW